MYPTRQNSANNNAGKGAGGEFVTVSSNRANTAFMVWTETSDHTAANSGVCQPIGCESNQSKGTNPNKPQ